ncbi:MAG: hypothetical protein KDC98_10805 [Planctomycetes bacterium]|nr:hypothetical protein [Planctomycetota bacterium]
MTDSPIRETWVVCDAARARAPADALRLTLGGRGCSISVDIGGIVGALSGTLSPQFHDLIRIASFVLAADGAVSRGRSDDDDDGEKWHRHFRFIVGVDDPDFWSTPGIRNPLEATLGFLSQDTFQFEFVPRGKKPPRQLMFAGPHGEPLVPWDDVQEVSLFSGGLDSFAGSADLIFRQNRYAVLVSHRSATKVTSVQNTLVAELSRLAREHGYRAPQHVALTLSRNKEQLRPERTQRTRSLLYAVIAGAVASLIGHDRLCAYENGIIAMNLPIAGSVVGARATRTAHPRVLVGFGKILSEVAGRTMTVENPFALKSRSELIRELASSPVLELAKLTVSCAYVHRQSTMHPHCGVCSQCLDRRFGFLGADMGEHDSELGYAVHLTRDPWEQASARDLLLNWIGAAYAYSECKSADDFLATHGDAARAVPFLMQSCGLDADAANRAVFDLHKRHGVAIRHVVDGIQTSAGKSRRSAENTLPSLLARPVRKTATRAGPNIEHVEFGIENRCLFIGGEWRITFRNGTSFAAPDSNGLRHLSTLLRSPGSVYTATALLDLTEHREPPNVLVLDDRGKRAVQAHVRTIEEERDEAQEVGDVDGAARCQSEIDALTQLVASSKEAAAPGTDAIAKAVEKDIRTALAVIREHSRLLADHLMKNLQIGSVLWYRRSALIWDVSLLTMPACPGTEWVPAKALVDANIHAIRNAREVARFCKRLEVPTRPGKTKSGGDHPRRRMVHEPTFRQALRRQQAEERHLQNTADRALTERSRRSGK